MAGLRQSWKNLSVSLTDAILTISMNRPKVNAMSIGLLNDLEQAVHHASQNDQVKGVHLRSNFRYFTFTTVCNFSIISFESMIQ